MEQEKTTVNLTNNKCKTSNMCRSSGAVYGLGLIGAIVYFIQHADTFWIGVLGVLKAFIWPAFFVYEFLEYLKF